MALGDGVARKFVAQVGEAELQPRGDFEGVGEGLGQVGKEALHFGGGFDVALGVALEQPSGFGQGDVVADAGEDVEQLALRRGGVGGAVGGHQRDAERAGAFGDGLIVGLFIAVVVALEFGVEVVAAEDVEQALVGVAGEADEAVGVFGDLVEGGRALAFGRPQLHAGDQPAKVAVAFAGLGEQRVSEAVGAGDLGADVCADASFFGRQMEAGGAVDAIAVHEGHGGHAIGRAGAGEFLGEGGAFEEGEGGAGVEFGVHEGPRFHHGDTENTEEARRNALWFSPFFLRVLHVSVVNTMPVLVIAPLHEPPRGAAVEAVKDAVGEGNVPFVARPGVGGPPVAGGAPGAGTVQYFAADGFGGNEAGMAFGQGDARGTRGTEQAQGQAWLTRGRGGGLGEARAGPCGRPRDGGCRAGAGNRRGPRRQSL